LTLIKDDFVFVDGKCTDDDIVLFDEEKNRSELLPKSIGNGSPGLILNVPEIHIIYNIQMKFVYLE
jgi:hypothetical protein